MKGFSALAGLGEFEPLKQEMATGRVSASYHDRLERLAYSTGLLSSSPSIRKTFRFRIPSVRFMAGTPSAAAAGLVLSVISMVAVAPINMAFDGYDGRKFKRALDFKVELWATCIGAGLAGKLVNGVTVKPFSVVFEEQFVPEIKTEQKAEWRRWALSIERAVFDGLPAQASASLPLAETNRLVPSSPTTELRRLLALGAKPAWVGVLFCPFCCVKRDEKREGPAVTFCAGYARPKEGSPDGLEHGGVVVCMSCENWGRVDAKTFAEVADIGRENKLRLDPDGSSEAAACSKLSGMPTERIA